MPSPSPLVGIHVSYGLFAPFFLGLPDSQDVAYARLVWEGAEWHEAAAELHLTPDQAKYLRAKAKERAARRLGVERVSYWRALRLAFEQPDEKR